MAFELGTLIDRLRVGGKEGRRKGGWKEGGIWRGGGKEGEKKGSVRKEGGMEGWREGGREKGYVEGWGSRREEEKEGGRDKEIRDREWESRIVIATPKYTAQTYTDLTCTCILTFPVRVSRPVTSLTFDPTRASPNE